MTHPIGWSALDDEKFIDETKALKGLAAKSGLNTGARTKVHGQAIELVERARALGHHKGMMESFLQEFGLSNKEGLALMCLAEALLRVPDAQTKDRLIAEKIGEGDWAAHAGQSDSLLVNASTWGLMLTGKVIDTGVQMRKNPTGFFKRMVSRMGEPAVRAAMMQAMRIMGEQFVLGRSIDEALQRGAHSKSAMFSFDMLGEAACSEADGERYFKRYADAIARTGAARGGGDITRVNGVSVKLSALHPRYEAVQEDVVVTHLYPRLLELARAAAKADIGFCLDAEEADRLVLSLTLLERLAHEPDLRGWNGLGLAVQAYQKRALLVIEKLQHLAHEAQRRFMVRLVKGAYWDTEIKHAQQMGWPDYPVWTTKTATDLNYLACARAMLKDEGAIFAQFATHNAHTLAAVRHMAKECNVTIEFQRLHGMGAALYTAAQDLYGDVPCRIYAPVGSHEDLLPYLVRRLLENGANTSFVHSFLDPDVPPQKVASDPFARARQLKRNSRIAVPPLMFGSARRNSAGLDLSQNRVRTNLAKAVAALDATQNNTETEPVTEASGQDIDRAFTAAKKAHVGWNAQGGNARADILCACADALEDDRQALIALMAREAGKTLEDGIAEVREAVDFCRYYAAQARTHFAAPQKMLGPAGETNHLQLDGRGVFVCISPWNFPLAIFTGQVMAALAAGNAVLAKPAEQTPLIAARAVQIFHQAGVPEDVLHLLPGRGETVGAALCDDPRHDGVVFTGGTDTAGLINRALAKRGGPIVPLIAETGGLNAMFVDTTALREQVVNDVVMSAFGAAGQRCSALRLLFLPQDTADDLIEGLIGAMQVLRLGDPGDPRTDVGPVIDDAALKALNVHIQRMTKEARVLHQIPSDGLKGTFFGPALVEIKSLDSLEREVFGPVLHVMRYAPTDIPALTDALAAKGYGLTLGVHSRLESFAQKIIDAVPAGNVYVNRNMIGAVVGVQPFGGRGLSGTGPKAGGPHYLPRFATEKVVTINITAQGGDPELLALGDGV